MNPVYMEKIPIKRIMYLPPKKITKISSLSFWAAIFFSDNTIQSANTSMIIPCPKSPNMIANRKGNVTIVYRAVTK